MPRWRQSSPPVSPPIEADLTKYNYVVAALDNTAKGEVEALILPPARDKHPALMSALIKNFGKTQSQKDNELLSLSGLGDRNPSALLRHIRSLNADLGILQQTLFLAQLPQEVRQILAASGKTDLDELATDADRIMDVPLTNRSPHMISGVGSTQRHTQRPPTNNTGLCYYHARFGKAARKCHQKGCPLGHLVVNDSDAETGATGKILALGHKDKNTMTVCDHHTGRTYMYLVDPGANFSVLPASATDKKSCPLSEPLMAANGSLRTWGKKKVTHRISPRRSFTQEFHIADVTEPIQGAVFFIANDLAIDMSRCCFISVADLTRIPTRPARQSPSVTGIQLPSANAANHFIAEFP